MAKQSSRELALERRKAQSTGGKKTSIAGAASPTRVRTAADVAVTRTDKSFVKPIKKVLNVSPSVSSSPSMHTVNHPSVPSTKRINNPSRELVLARREALSKKGKKADNSKDRTRVDVAKTTSVASTKTAPQDSVSACCEPCAQKEHGTSKESSQGLTTISKRTVRRNSKNNNRRSIGNPSRALVLARRESMSKHGKSASKQPTSAASVARQGNPDLSSREISQRVRELRSKSGATGSQRTCGSRPCGPNRNGAKKAALAADDAHWKVGSSETSSGQIVTGTQANRSIKTTGNEASTCRSITGTQYLGAETINTFCDTNTTFAQPSKVSVTNTSHGNQVTGNEVGRSEKVTGDEPGTCKSLTGTEYISANQLTSFCGDAKPSPRKVGQSLTADGRKVSGVIVGRSSNVTGDEAGSDKHLTGDQYLGSDPLPDGRPAQKVGAFNTLNGTGVTGTGVGRATSVTGNEQGSCKNITGDEYVGSQQYESFCKGRPEPEALKVGLSLTNKAQTVSGTMTGRSTLVTGDEPGTCKTVTGTPYAGLEDAGQLCNTKSIEEIHQRTPRRVGTPGPSMTGQQPGIGGVMTGAEKGACEPLTGTPYVGADQLSKACGTHPSPSNERSSYDSGFGTRFTVESPARQAQAQRESISGVTGISYENGANITGPFDMAPNKVTGTEQFRFDSNNIKRNTESLSSDSTLIEEGSRPKSRITGEGQSAGLNITGDDWARGENVTGTEGASARRRNPSRPGPGSAMPPFDLKRNQEVAQPDFLITGSSGNTREGQLVTFSGGARG